jgi:polysaccharide chain length determinant protein (PEP-CTERM system associated)
MEASTPMKHYLDVAWRRKWWLVAPMVLATAASVALAMWMPKLYRASTTILVARQSVPEDIARSTVTLHVEERLRSLQVQMLSRSYLEPIAREFQMIPAGAGDAEIEATCRKLSRQISPEFDVHDYSWFKISVQDVDPKRAASIANRLADRFIEQNSQLRASQAAGTLEATGNWQEKYRQELAQRDAEIAAFKQQHAFELADQQPANAQFLYSAQNRSTQLTSDIQGLQDRLAALRAQPSTPPSADASRLVTAQAELAVLLESYTDEHPLVKRKREQIAELIRSPAGANVPAAGANPADDAQHGPIAIQIVTIENEVKGLERDLAQANSDIETYRARIGNAAPTQQKLLELTRDYDELKRRFDTAVVQTEQAQRAQDIEESNMGDQFQIQDRASPTTAPLKRNFRYVAAVLALGLVLGVGAATARDLADQTVRGEEDFAAGFPDLPVYSVIPNLDVGQKTGSSA